LWTSDGTSAGTLEVTPITGASSAGLAPTDITVFGSGALARVSVVPAYCE
jgi:ELWxxDGT repeat protein